MYNVSCLYAHICIWIKYYYYQGCALAEPGGPWCLTFVPGRLENLSFFIEIICWAPWISLVQSTGLPSIFLRAQPWLLFIYYRFIYYRFTLLHYKQIMKWNKLTLATIRKKNNNKTKLWRRRQPKVPMCHTRDATIN